MRLLLKVVVISLMWICSATTLEYCAGRPRVQVTLTDERTLAKATALAWFTNHKEPVVAALSESKTVQVDDAYKIILESSERAGARSKYLTILKGIKKELVHLRSDCATLPPPAATTADKPPDFAPLISDPAMQRILVARWVECTKCLAADVPLAATVMMGGLLEALLLARINRETIKKPIFTAKAAPKDRSKRVAAHLSWPDNPAPSTWLPCQAGSKFL